jgi:hypothetical protein
MEFSSPLHKANKTSMVTIDTLCLKEEADTETKKTPKKKVIAGSSMNNNKNKTNTTASYHSYPNNHLDPILIYSIP